MSPRPPRVPAGKALPFPGGSPQDPNTALKQQHQQWSWDRTHADLRCRFGLWDRFRGWHWVCALGSGCRGCPRLNPAEHPCSLPCPASLPWSHEPDWGPGPSSPTCTAAGTGNKPTLPWLIPPLSALPRKGFQGIQTVGKQPPLPAAGGRMGCCVPRTSLGHWHSPAPLGTPLVSSTKRQDSPAKKNLWDTGLKSFTKGNIFAKESL